MSLIAIVFTTFLGFFIGIVRLSQNWLVKTLAAWYVEIIRNTPLLLQILFWYLGVFSLLPRPKQSIELGVLHLNNRGFYFPEPLPEPGFWMTGVAMVVAVVVSLWLAMWGKKEVSHVGAALSGSLVGARYADWSAVGGFPGNRFAPRLGAPHLARFQFSRWWQCTAGILRLDDCPGCLPRLAYCRVRARRHSFHRERPDRGVLFAGHQTLLDHAAHHYSAGDARHCPVVDQHLGGGGKNSSLAIAIGYPDLVAVYMQTSLNQSGHAIEIVAMVMIFYSSVSLIISAALNYYNKLVQLQER